jgi:hypothetical protein
LSGCSGDDTNVGGNTVAPDSGVGAYDSSVAVATDGSLSDARTPDAGFPDGALSDAPDALIDASEAGADVLEAASDVTQDVLDAAGTAPPNMLYTMSNASDGNAVFAFMRAFDGTLTPLAAPFATLGNGSDASLGAQASIAIDNVDQRLYVVNYGDGSFSIFPIMNNGSLGAPLRVVPTADAGTPALLGPKSIAFFGSTVYVLFEGNASTPSMISGWTVSLGVAGLTATAIVGSSLPLSSSGQSVDPAEIAFTPDGKGLVVTEKQTGMAGSIAGAGSIDSFAVDATGRASKIGFFPTAVAAGDAGLQMTPYGFAFYGATLIVSEAGSALVGAYTYAGGDVAPVVGSTQFASTDRAPCWVAVASDWAYVANAQGPTLRAHPGRLVVPCVP